ncbi:restriction endonuclease subunit S [Massilia oculi]|uniref:Restriction endonuclease subunit S n=1 Tax=Massilia hydrophila TaxID=3044279 RepID=A0ABS7Y9R4_9BURK|nr:restriction endonuclease subunit S [Massilia oculi]MCA1856426.1 restriction endonuclease subunit S [Massilia oculi]
MKAGWMIKPLGEVCEFQRGLTYAKSDEVDVSNNVILRATNIDLSTNLLDLRELRYINDAVTVPASKKVKKNSLLICTASGSKSHLGKVAYIDDDYDFAFGGFMGMLTPSEILLPRYFFHLMTSGVYKDFIATLADGANINNLKFFDLQRFAVPIPALAEQHRIVAILDGAFDGIATAKANAERNLQNAQELVGIGFHSITENLGRTQWPIRQVAALKASHKGAMRTGPFGSQLLHTEFVDDGIAVLGIDNAVANEFRWDRRRYITKEKYEQMARYRVFPGDVLITIMGTCGRCAVVPENIPLAINTKHLCCITLNRQACLPEYLHIYFLHDRTARDYLSAQAKGSIMAGLNMGIISELPVRLPSIEIQAKIVDQFDAYRSECERLESTQRQKLIALDNLKKSLLHQAFTGQL